MSHFKSHKALEHRLQQSMTGSMGDDHASTTSNLAKEVLSLQRAVGNQAITHLLQQRQHNPDAVVDVPSIVQNILHSAGQPLDAATRDLMETNLGSDFSQVRIHSDTEAANSAEAINALAYTVGQNVVFGEGQYAPGTNKGHETIAHELTHVIQQKAPGPKSPGRSGQVEHQYEREAEANASAISSPQRVNGHAYVRISSNAHSTLNQSLVVPANQHYNPDQVFIQRKQKAADQKPPEEPTEEEQAVINDLAGTIMDIVESGMENPLRFETNWGTIQQQILHPTLLKSPDKRKEKQFPELYQRNVVDGLQKLKREWRTLVAKKVKDQLLENLSFVPHVVTGQAIDYQQEFKELQPIIRNAFTVEHYIAVRDALIRKFSSAFDFDEAKGNIGQYYSSLVRANFPSEKSKSADALVHPNLQKALQKALNLLWNLGWTPEQIDGSIETIRTLLGLDVRANVNVPTVKAKKSTDDEAPKGGDEEQVNLSYHSFGWAIDINPNLNPNVHPADFPSKLVEGFTHEDVYKGKNVQTIRPELALPAGKRSGKLAHALPQPTVEQTLTAVIGLYAASKKFQGIYENKSTFSRGLIDYASTKGKLQLPYTDVDALYTAVANAYKGEVSRREQEEHGKEKKKLSGPILPRLEYLIAELTNTFGLQRSDAEEVASFMLEAYGVFVKSREMMTVLIDPHTSAEQSTTEPATIPQEAEVEGKKVDPNYQGTKATIAAQGFINLLPELITALVHADGGGLKWLGTAEGTKDFMHFELKINDQPELPGMRK